MSIPVGTSATITTTFRTADGTLTDPAAVTAQIQSPAGTVTTPTPTSGSVGVWVTDVPTDEIGIWFYEITGTGNNIDLSDVGSFCVIAGIQAAS